MSRMSSIEYLPTHAAVRDLLPAYCAGSLSAAVHAEVEAAILTAPGLLAEAMELMIINDRLLAVRSRLDFVMGSDPFTKPGSVVVARMGVGFRKGV